MTTLSLQQTLQERVSEKIKSSFVEMIPAEEFDKLVSSALDEFMNGARSKRFRNVRKHVGSNYPGADDMGYVSTDEPIPTAAGKEPYNTAHDVNTLPGMIMQSLKIKGSEKLKEILDGPEFSSIWNGGQLVASELIAKMIGENTDLFVQQLFGGIIMNTINQVRSQMQTNNGRF